MAHTVNMVINMATHMHAEMVGNSQYDISHMLMISVAAVGSIDASRSNGVDA